MEKILIGTTNKGKIVKFGDMLSNIGIEYITPDDLNLRLKIEETGYTTSENAKLKSIAYHEATSMTVLCDDSALKIEGLSEEEQPGVFVHRYNAKNELSDEDIIKVFSELIQKLGGKANGSFLYTLSIVKSNGEIFEKTFSSPRPFVAKPSGKLMEGFPLRSLIFFEKYNRYMSEMTLEEMATCEGSAYNEQKEWIKQVLNS